MRVGPSEPAYRSRFQTTLSCAGKEPGWWALRKRPRMTGSGMIQGGERKWTTDEVSKRQRWRQNRRLVVLRDKSRGILFTAWAASGIKVARPWIRLLYGTWEPVVPMLREKSKWRTHEDESTDAEHRGGAARSSDEVSVMEMERRGCIVRLYWWDNQKWEDLVG